MNLKKLVAMSARRLKRWLLEEEKAYRPEAEVPFDNTSTWVGQSFRKLMPDLIVRRRPAYVWGILQGCALGKVLGYESVSVLEFGVAGGAGLVAMERIAEAAESLPGISNASEGQSGESSECCTGCPPVIAYQEGA